MQVLRKEFPSKGSILIRILNVQTVFGKRVDHFIKGESIEIDGKNLLMLPALIDPHVHFRTPGAEYKENWESGSLAAIAGGVTTVFDMPNNTPSCITAQALHQKKQLIESQLKVPLRFALYFGADQNHLDEIPKVKDEIIALKIYMGSSTGNLLMTDPKALETAFQIAAENDVLVAVHAEDEDLIQKRKTECKAALQYPKDHSVIRNPEVAARAVQKAIELAKKYHTRLYIAHVSTKEELDLIRQAKKEKLPIYAEATPHHLFLNTELYETLDTLALVNPPLREDTTPLWEALEDGTIDTIGTDHAPHLLEEKKLPYGKAPSGFPSIEIYLALLLNAYHEKRISLEKIVSLTRTRIQEIFRWPDNDDVVLVDLNKIKKVDSAHFKSRAKWSPYEGWTLKGWPTTTILKGKIYSL